VTNERVTLPVVITQQTCQVLELVLGPLHLELLGLIIDLNQVVLTITADPRGGILGQLLSALAGGPAGAAAPRPATDHRPAQPDPQNPARPVSHDRGPLPRGPGQGPFLAPLGAASDGWRRTRTLQRSRNLLSGRVMRLSVAALPPGEFNVSSALPYYWTSQRHDAPIT